MGLCEISTYRAKCDECGFTEEVRVYGYSNHANEILRNNGWCITVSDKLKYGSKYVCPHCVARRAT